MAYTVSNTDGSREITVADGTFDTTTYSVTLIGKNITNYGDVFVKNSIRHLENFASATAPSVASPLVGQVWYDKTGKVLRVYKSASEGWVRVSSVVSETPPSDGLSDGATYFDSSDNKLKIFKTHHVLCSLGKDNFTDNKNTLGAIYIVRDPRNVISSILYHFNLSNTDEALNFIQREEKFIGNVKNKVNYPLHTLIGSWKTNYNSWKFFGKNFLLVKYEDLILNPNTEFKRIANYITITTNIKFSEEQIKKSVAESSFENLRKLEDKNGFIESIKDSEDNNKKKFFNLGPKNTWKENLNKNVIDEIESSFNSEMKELGYI